MNTPIRSLKPDELLAWLKQHSLPAFRAKQIQEWLNKRFAVQFEEMSNLPKNLRETLATRFSPCSLEPQQIFRADDKTVKWLSALADGIDEAIEALEASIDSRAQEDITEQAFHIRDELLEKMAALRSLCDQAETLTAASYWPFPTYGELLFGV